MTNSTEKSAYKQYRRLLQFAQEQGDGALASSAARLLLSELRRQFQELPREKRRSIINYLVATIVRNQACRDRVGAAAVSAATCC